MSERSNGVQWKQPNGGQRPHYAAVCDVKIIPRNISKPHPTCQGCCSDLGSQWLRYKFPRPLNGLRLIRHRGNKCKEYRSSLKSYSFIGCRKRRLKTPVLGNSYCPTALLPYNDQGYPVLKASSPAAYLFSRMGVIY
jgi:hypothetical protein